MKLFIFTCLLLINLSCNAAQIVAKVNDQPISAFDATARAKLISIQNSTPLTKEKKSEYVQAALDSLIDDKVKIIEAQKNGFSVSDKEVKEAIAHLESQNGMKKGEMAKVLEKNNIPLSILEEQIHADLMWLQVLQKNKRSLHQPTQAEIDQLKNNLKNELKEEGFYVAEMLISNQKEAEECYQELHKGKSFQELAKKHSIASSAQKGGEVGWVEKNKYSKEIFEVLKQMGPGDVSTPLKTPNGYLILLVIDRKYAITTETVPVWELAQMALPANKTSALGDTINKLNSCENFLNFAKDIAIKESVKSGMISPQQLPRELKSILQDAKLKKVVGPIQTPDSDLFFMKCQIINKKVIPEDSELKLRLEAKSMENLSEKLLRNAKRFTVIEMR